MSEDKKKPAASDKVEAGVPASVENDGMREEEDCCCCHECPGCGEPEKE